MTNRLVRFHPGRRDFLAAAGVLALAAATSCGRGKPYAAVGTGFPAFQLTDVDGRTCDSAALTGHPLVVNFWATWCPPCRTEMPDLDSVHRRHAAQGLRVLGISIDEDANPILEFRLKTPVSFPLMVDAERKLALGLGIRSYPTTFLVARSGRVSEVLVGPRPWPDYPGIAALLA